MSPAGKPHGPLVALSTASVFPDRTPDAFELAARLGYDGIEVMVSADAVSQDVDVIRRLVDYHGIPVLAVHSPCLLVTQRVWGREPWGKLTKSADVAEKLGARVVVVHPPFRWQRDYARDFTAGLERMRNETDVVFAVENMYPLRAGGAEVAPYSPHWNPVQQDYPAVTLDLSHTSVSGSDAMAMAADLGSRLAHVHLADGTGLTNRDEHLVPGRGAQPCAPLLETLAAEGYTGVVVLEVNTRRAGSREARQADLAEALEFTRRHLAAGEAGPDGQGGPAGAGTGGTRLARDGATSLSGARRGTGRRSRPGGGGEEAGVGGSAEKPVAGSSGGKPAARRSGEKPAARGSIEKPGARGSGEKPAARRSGEKPGVRGSGGRSRMRGSGADPRPGTSGEEGGGQARDQGGRGPASRRDGSAAARRMAGRVRGLGWAAISRPAGRGTAGREDGDLASAGRENAGRAGLTGTAGNAGLTGGSSASPGSGGVETVAPGAVGLGTAGLTTALGTVRLESAGLESAGLESAGLEAVGLEATGLEATGLGTMGLESASRSTTRETSDRGAGGPAAGARRSVFGRGSALAVRRWRRLDERARSGASCRS